MPEDYLFSGEDGDGTCWKVRVKASLVAELDRLYRNYFVEIGAAVVGRISDDGSTKICSAILPLVVGKHSELEIGERRANLITGHLAEIWRETGGEIYYLGDWHTHPGAPSEPSKLDWDTSAARSADSRAQCHQHVMLISGWDGLRCMLTTEKGDGLTLTRHSEPEADE